MIALRGVIFDLNFRVKRESCVVPATHVSAMVCNYTLQVDRARTAQSGLENPSDMLRLMRCSWQVAAHKRQQSAKERARNRFYKRRGPAVKMVLLE